MILSGIGGYIYYLNKDQKKILNRTSNIKTADPIRQAKLYRFHEDRISIESRKLTSPLPYDYYDPAFDISQKERLNAKGIPGTGWNEHNIDERGFTTTSDDKHEYTGLRMLSVNFDNDIFNNTDYYYTHGLRIEFIHPSLSYLPTSRILFPKYKTYKEYYGISLVQNIFTPINPDTEKIQRGDRPFAGYLYIGFSKTSILEEKRIHFRSEFDLGILGPASFGGYVQKTIHEIEPVGWVNQVENDLVINYSMSFTKGILEKGRTEINAHAEARAGTLYTDLSPGLSLKFGNFLETFRYFSPVENTNFKFKYFIFANITGRIKVYDATLQGGLFNQTSIYTIPGFDISRFVFTPSAGIDFSYRFINLRLEQFYVSPEFKGARHHLYGSISCGISF